MVVRAARLVCGLADQSYNRKELPADLARGKYASHSVSDRIAAEGRQSGARNSKDIRKAAASGSCPPRKLERLRSAIHESQACRQARSESQTPYQNRPICGGCAPAASPLPAGLRQQTRCRPWVRGLNRSLGKALRHSSVPASHQAGASA